MAGKNLIENRTLSNEATYTKRHAAAIKSNSQTFWRADNGHSAWHWGYVTKCPPHTYTLRIRCHFMTQSYTISSQKKKNAHNSTISGSWFFFSPPKKVKTIINFTVRFQPSSLSSNALCLQFCDIRSWVFCM